MARRKRIRKLELIEARKALIVANQTATTIVDTVDDWAGTSEEVVEEVNTTAVEEVAATTTAPKRRTRRTRKTTSRVRRRN